MNPFQYQQIVQDRIQRTLKTAEAWRLSKQATAPTGGLWFLRSALGQGLIAIGERLVDRSETDDGDLRRAA